MTVWQRVLQYQKTTKGNAMNRLQFLLVIVFGTSMFIGCGDGLKDKVASTITKHPVFLTPVSMESNSRPSILVDLIDDSEDFFFTAELYLAVQSSRFPKDTFVILPINVGDFAGVRTRFVQLPFEVVESDTLIFNLLDDDSLSKADAQLLLNGCRASGYCLHIAGAIYCPPSGRLLRPVVNVASEILGHAIINDVQLHGFENFGTAIYHVPSSLPKQCFAANELSVRSSSNRVPAILKIFGSAN